MTPLPPLPPTPIPPPVPVETHPNRAGGLKPPLQPRVPFDPTRLTPEHAYYAHSPPRFRPQLENHAVHLRPLDSVVATPAAVAALRPPPAVPGTEPKKHDPRKVRGSARRKARKGAWKKLLWVKQSYPDNYTDTETFLDHLQRNPRLRPYDFWPLVADSTVIVQHVCSVTIFVCCFVAIEKGASPVSVVSWGSIGTVLGWILWDFWVWKEQEEAIKALQAAEGGGEVDDGSSASSTTSGSNLVATGPQNSNQAENNVHGLGLNLANPGSLRRCSTGLSSPSFTSLLSINAPSGPHAYQLFRDRRRSLLSSRSRQRLNTIKSALLIYCALLGLSPILKSLTKSTASDSIWAMSCWLMVINIFSFEYGSGEGADATKFPASLSTNAALMASTVLASRLRSTTHVFSLTLFSIEVFGLFPVFRRHLRQVSWTGHLLLTFALVIGAGGGVGITLRGGWAAGIVGAFLGSLLTAFAMGGCSWWLISLQKYKNVVTGPWDPARPIVRTHWD